MSTREVRRLKTISGVEYPAWVKYRQLLVTGPPGSGKTSAISAISGWPEEGYLDLAQKDWWRSRELSFRPREVHLGIPFRGLAEGLSVFDKSWIEARPPLEPALTRIELPSGPREWSWKRRYVLEFLLPAAEAVFAARQERSYRQTHPVDRELSEVQVRRQLAIYRSVALYLHKAGLIVLVRDSFGGPPRVFEDPLPAGAPPWPKDSEPKKGLITRLVQLFTGVEAVMGAMEQVHLAGSGTKVSFKKLPIEVTTGSQTLQVHLDHPVGEGDGSPVRRVVVYDPQAAASGIAGFIRLKRGERVRVGKGGRDRLITPNLPEEAGTRLNIANEGDHLTLVDLHSPTGTDVVGISDAAEIEKPRKDRLARLRRITDIFGGPIRTVEADEAYTSLQTVLENLEKAPFRPSDSRGRPGGLVELPDEIVPVILGDLHANLDNFIRVLIENRCLEELEREKACLILLGDLVHVDEDQGRHEMDSSLLMTDFALKLMQAFPRGVIHLRGNHDSFSPELTKDGVPQGRFWRERVRELRGNDYLEALQRFYDLLPYIVYSKGFVACHAGPPIETVTREELIDIAEHPRLMHQLTWNRLQSVSTPTGYSKANVKALKKALELKKPSALIVSHNPPPGEEAVWLNFGGVKRHHLVYSAKRSRLALFTRINGRMVPLTYRAEPLVELANRLRATDGG